MPAAVFRADYDQLKEVAQDFESQAGVVEGFLRDIQQKKQVLHDGDWVGVAATKFYQRMDSEVLPELKRLAEALHLTSQVTKAILDLVKQLEQDASGLFKKGAGNVGSEGASDGFSSAAGAVGAAAGAVGALGGVLGGILNNLFGGANAAGGQQSAFDKFSDQLNAVRDMLGGRSSESDSLIPSAAILDAVRQDLAGQGQMAENGWQQSAASGGGSSGGSSGGGSGASGGAPTATPPTEQSKPSGGGGGGGGGGPSGGGSMGASGNSQVGGGQGMVGSAVAGARGGGGMFGGDSIGSLAGTVIAGMTRSAAGAAPIAEMVLMVGASAGGLLFATKGSGGAGWAAGQLAQSASSPIYRGVRG